MKLLVVEDEPGIADFLRRGLEAEGYDVDSVADGAEGEARALAGGYDLVLLDLMLPGRSGEQILEAIRTVLPSLPVIVLTARGQIEDRVAGLDLGATDYVTKPFSFDELAARVRAHLRSAQTEDPTRLEVDDLVIDFLRRRVTRGGTTVSLSATEFDLLALLARHAGQVVPRERILEVVWGYEHDPGTNILGVYIGYLRRKLALPGRPAPIETQRSVGYKLRAGR